MFALAVGKIIGETDELVVLAAQVRRKEYSSRRHCAEKVHSIASSIVQKQLNKEVTADIIASGTTQKPLKNYWLKYF